MGGIWDRDYAKREEWCGAHPPACNCRKCVIWRNERDPERRRETDRLEDEEEEWKKERRQGIDPARKDRGGVEERIRVVAPKCVVCGGEVLKSDLDHWAASGKCNACAIKSGEGFEEDYAGED